MKGDLRAARCIYAKRFAIMHPRLDYDRLVFVRRWRLVALMAHLAINYIRSSLEDKVRAKPRGGIVYADAVLFYIALLWYCLCV